MAVFPVVIDACVLFKASVRDTLLRSAEYGLYRVHWSQKILDETTENLIENPKRPMTPEQASHLVSEMSKAFPEAMVDVPEELISSMKNDPKDRHVAAAAVTCSAQVIVTENLKDFKPEDLAHLHIEAQHPEVFLLFLFGREPQLMMRILVEQAEDLNGITFDELLDHKLAPHVPQFVKAVRRELE